MLDGTGNKKTDTILALLWHIREEELCKAAGQMQWVERRACANIHEKERKLGFVLTVQR